MGKPTFDEAREAYPLPSAYPKDFCRELFMYVPLEGSLLDVGIEHGFLGALCRVYRPKLRVVALDGWRPYLDYCRERRFYDEYVEWNFSTGDLPTSTSYDAACALEVIEHLEKDAGRRLIHALKRIARTVVISTPNGWMKQGALEGNPLQRHLSAWSIRDLEEMGFKVRGVSDLRLPRIGRFEPSLILNSLGWIVPSLSKGLLGIWKVRGLEE